MTSDNFDPNSFEGQVIKGIAEIKEQLKTLPDHEKRLRWIEKLAYGLVGAWFLLSAMVGFHMFGGH